MCYYHNKTESTLLSIVKYLEVWGLMTCIKNEIDNNKWYTNSHSEAIITLTLLCAQDAVQYTKFILFS